MRNDGHCVESPLHMHHMRSLLYILVSTPDPVEAVFGMSHALL